VKGPFLAAVGIGALVLYLLGVGSCGSSSGAPTVFAVRFAGTRRGEKVALVSPFGFALGLLATPAASFVGPLGVFASLLKIGSVLFGSGYVLLAFLRSEFVYPGPLTNQQLLDAVAVGQVTPRAVFTTDFSATRRMEARGGAEGMGSTRTYLEGMVKLLAVLAFLPPTPTAGAGAALGAVILSSRFGDKYTSAPGALFVLRAFGYQGRVASIRGAYEVLGSKLKPELARLVFSPGKTGVRGKERSRKSVRRIPPTTPPAP
jgi:hypothetical protein